MLSQFQGSIEYGSPVPGQILGGRWKPLHYMLRASIFADQLLVCTADGSCFVANDSPFEFTGTATVRVLNVISGASSTILSQPLSLPPGPRFTQWFCGTGNLSGGEDVVRLDASGKSRLDTGNATYVLHRRQIPNPSGNFTKELQATSELACEAACNAEPACLGFTSMPSLQLTTCWLYSSAPRLNGDNAWWWQKPGTPHIPAPPPPPLPPPLPPPASGPPLLKCTDWNATAVWKAIGCAVNGVNCVLDIRVNRSSGEVTSWSTVPFTAPKDMDLPAAAVGIAVADKPPPGAETVDIVLTTNATAIYVVLTTQAAGRFSDNVLLLEAEAPRLLRFMAWGELDYDLLKSTIRVEHLAENLATAPLKSDDTPPLSISVVDHGADSTGQADATEAFRAALAAASQYGGRATSIPVVVPSGTFLITGTLNITMLTLAGVGPSAWVSDGAPQPLINFRPFGDPDAGALRRDVTQSSLLTVNPSRSVSRNIVV